MHQERIDFIKNLTREAGRLTLAGHGKTGQVPKDVAGGYDITTEYDLRTEELIKKRILEEYGEPVLGEEEGLIGDREMARRHLWIVDPIDGTFNYQRGLPLYAVSIAFCENSIPVCGAILLPALDQLFFAVKGKGAFMVAPNAPSPVPIRVSQETEMVRLVISLAGKEVYKLLAACAKEGIPWRSLRLSLCAAASLAEVACGRIDAFCDTALSLWDVAAGDVIIQEAGGPPIMDYGGVPIFPRYVKRRIDLNNTDPFPCLATSGSRLREEPFGRLLSSAGLQRKE